MRESIDMLLSKGMDYDWIISGDRLLPVFVEAIADEFIYRNCFMSKCRTVYSCGCYNEGHWLSNEFIKETCDHIIESMEMIDRLVFKVRYDKEEERGIPTLRIERKDACPECSKKPQRVAELKKVMRPDSIFQGSIYSHGLATGFGAEVSVETAEMHLKSFLKLLGSEKEICCSWKTQQIGGFGLFVRGEVTIASNEDLWSYVGHTGYREFNVDEYEEYIIDKREDLRLGWKDHTEFFVRPKEVVAFWAKDWFLRDVPGGRELVERLRKAGYKVYITRRRHR